MARPKKTGLDYFPFDVDFFNDEKIEAISGEFGIKGEIVAIKLLAAIYRNGYFIEWSEMLQMKMLKTLPSISKELLTEIVQRLVRWNFFDEGLFNSDNVLTSRGIQRRYFEAMKRNSLSDSLPFLIVSAAETPINVTETTINTAKTPQSKEKESKVNISFLEKKKQKSTSVDFGEEEKNNQPLNAEKETSPPVAPAPPPFNFRKAMLSEGFAPELVDEWLKIRKAKKAVNTERAFKTFIEQVRKTNQDINTVLSIIVQKQWKGFEADWLHSTQAPLQSPQQTIIDEYGNIITPTNHYTPPSGKPPYVAGRQTAEDIRQNSTGWGTHTFGNS
jgi:hypothetical protein|nr:MAG TPA: protein of unknown function (DUF4373) [Caudoviricetes sp.]